MTQSTRTLALIEAVKLGTAAGETELSAILATAASLHVFIMTDDDAAPAPVVSKPTPDPLPKVSTPKADTQKPQVIPAKASKPLTDKGEPAKAAKKAAPPAEDDTTPAIDKKAIQGMVAKLLAADQRDELVALFAEYDAESASSVPADKYEEVHARMEGILAAS